MLTRDRVILSYVASHPGCARSQIRREVAPDASASTVWRSLRRLVDAGRLEVVGEGRATRYRAVGREVVLAHLDVPVNMRQPMAYRPGFAGGYIPNESRYLTDPDRAELRKAGTPVPDPFLAAQGVTFARRVLEELEIDMSWASSRLEGNSYDLLETDRLIRYARESPGKPGRDATMILNHRNAIRYVVENLDDIEIGWPDLRNIHALLSHGLIQDPTLRGGLRRLPVAIGKSAYTPLEDRFTLQEEFDALVARAERITDPFEQSFFLLVHIPYLQPFADVNKRTSRIAALIPLLKADLAPMSFFGINDREYIRGLIGVYELNDVSLMREAFVNGYIATARRYRYLRPVAITPAKGDLEYRFFTSRAMQRCVLKWRAFEPTRVRRMIERANIPPEDRDHVLEHVGLCFRGLTPGNAILYGLKPDELEGLEGIAGDE